MRRRPPSVAGRAANLVGAVRFVFAFAAGGAQRALVRGGGRPPAWMMTLSYCRETVVNKGVTAPAHKVTRANDFSSLAALWRNFLTPNPRVPQGAAKRIRKAELVEGDAPAEPSAGRSHGPESVLSNFNGLRCHFRASSCL